MEKYPRGRRGGFAKALGGATCARVRLPPSPPYPVDIEFTGFLLQEFNACIHFLRIVIT